MKSAPFVQHDVQVFGLVVIVALFAIVIVGGLIAALIMSVFLLPTLYVWIAGETDVLPGAEEGFEVGEHVD